MVVSPLTSRNFEIKSDSTGSCGGKMLFARRGSDKSNLSCKNKSLSRLQLGNVKYLFCEKKGHIRRNCTERKNN